MIPGDEAGEVKTAISRSMSMVKRGQMMLLGKL